MGFTYDPKAPEFKFNMTFTLNATVTPSLPTPVQQTLSSGPGPSPCPHWAQNIETQNAKISEALCQAVDEPSHEATRTSHFSTDNNEEKPATRPVIACSTAWLRAQQCEAVRGPETHTPKAIGGKATRNMGSGLPMATRQLRYRFPRPQGRYDNRPQAQPWPVMEFGDLAKSFDMDCFMYRSFLSRVLEEDRELADKRRPLPTMPDTAAGKGNTIFGTCIRFPEILDLKPEILLSQRQRSYQTSKRSAGQKQVTQSFDHELIIIYREAWNRRCVDRYRALCKILGLDRIDMIEKDWQRGHFYRYEELEPAQKGTEESYVPAEFLKDHKEVIMRSSPDGIVGNKKLEALLVSRYYCIMRSFYMTPALHVQAEGLLDTSQQQRRSTTYAVDVHVDSWSS